MEKYFHYGVDSSGETVFRISDSSDTVYFIGKCNSLFSDAFGNDELKTWEVRYDTFEDFWRKFTEFTDWFRAHPVFIHHDLKAFIESHLQSFTDNKLYIQHHKEAWKRALENNEPGEKKLLAKGLF